MSPLSVGLSSAKDITQQTTTTTTNNTSIQRQQKSSHHTKNSEKKGRQSALKISWLFLALIFVR